MSFKDSPLEGTVPGDERKRWFVSFSNQWDSFDPFRHKSWRDFTLVQLGGEWASYSGRIEIELALLGFGLTLTYVYDFSFNENISDLHDQLMAELGARNPGLRIEDPHGVLEEMKGKPPLP